MYVNAHTLWANFGLNAHTLYAKFGLNVHTLKVLYSRKRMYVFLNSFNQAAPTSAEPNQTNQISVADDLHPMYLHV